MQTRFSFAATPVMPKKDAKRPFYREVEFNRNGKKVSASAINLGLKESDNNMVFVEAFDSPNDTILTMDSDFNKIEVAWKDRFDEDVVSKVANVKKYTVDIGEPKTFITAYDMIQCLKEDLPAYKGNILVTGQIRKDPNGKYSETFDIQNVYAIDDERKLRFNVVMDLFYNKDSVDKSDYKSDKKNLRQWICCSVYQ